MKPLRTAAAAFLIAGTLAAGSFLAGTRVAEEREPGRFQVVLDTARELRERAATGVSDDELARAAIRGMLEALDDPYAAYLSPSQQEEVRDLLGGSIVGIGVWLEEDPRGLRITSLVTDAPAAASDLRPGDLIVEADGQSVTGVPLDEAAPLLQGPEGSVLRLVVVREGRRFEASVERARIEVSDVQGRILEESGVGYVRVVQFGRGAAEELEAKIRGLLAEGAEELILDLRGNSGGIAAEAIDVAGLFLSDGLVARIRERGRPEREVRATEEALPSFPLAVLVDGGTASASELVAGALQDRGRGTLVGTRTHGKGSVLSVSDLDGDSSIQYTTAHFLTPSGRQIEGRGIAPDVSVLPGGSDDAQLARAVAVVRGR